MQARSLRGLDAGDGGIGNASAWVRWPPAKKLRFVGDIAALMEESLQTVASETAGSDNSLRD
jgi:hypothetical protein